MKSKKSKWAHAPDVPSTGKGAHQRTEPGYHLRLDAQHLTAAHPKCGCRLARDLATGGVALYLCPTHAAAPGLLAGAKRAAEFCRGVRSSLAPIGAGVAVVLNQLNEITAKAEGGAT